MLTFLMRLKIFFLPMFFLPMFFLAIFFLPILFFTPFVSITYAGSTPVPQILMEKTSQKMIAAFIDNDDAIKTNPNIAHELIKKNLVPNINFPLMSRWVLGKSWRKASPSQKQEFHDEFQLLVIRFYSEALLQFLKNNKINQDIIKFMPFRGEIKDKYATVRSKVYPPSGTNAIKVNYELYYGKSGQWKVYDLKIEGISLISTYRSSFRNIITKKGIDGLILDLKNKNISLQKTS